MTCPQNNLNSRLGYWCFSSKWKRYQGRTRSITAHVLTSPPIKFKFKIWIFLYARPINIGSCYDMSDKKIHHSQYPSSTHISLLTHLLASWQELDLKFSCTVPSLLGTALIWNLCKLTSLWLYAFALELFTQVRGGSGAKGTKAQNVLKTVINAVNARPAAMDTSASLVRVPMYITQQIVSMVWVYHARIGTRIWHAARVLSATLDIWNGVHVRNVEMTSKIAIQMVLTSAAVGMRHA